jgi:hypothetical protein
MANVIKLKKSIVAGNIPTTANLALGEGAVNHTDQKIYFRHPGTGAVWNFAGGASTTYIVQSDFQSPYSYIGVAISGSDVSSPVWNISRIEVNNDGSETTLHATGAWTNRTTLIYT